MSEVQTKMLLKLLEHCDRSTRMPLGFLGVDEDVRECPSDPEHVVNFLTKEFSREELAASGVVAATEGGSVTLTAALTGSAQFIVLRDATTGEPIELLTSTGCLSPSALPIFEILRDRHTQQLLAQVGSHLFVAFDIDEVVMLRACGCPATLASGLAELPLEDISRFCTSFDVDCVKSDLVESGDVVNGTIQQPRDPADPGRVPLVFVAWSPSSLVNAVPRQLKVVIDYFRQLNRFMGVELFNLQVWNSDEETLARLRFIASRGAAAIFRDALRDAVLDIGENMMNFGMEKRASVERVCDFPTAVARLQAVNSSNPNSHPMGAERRKRAWSDFEKYLNEQIINRA